MPLLSCAGGTLALPSLVLVDRIDGGNLVVHPPHEVWERSELTAKELTGWAFLIAAAGRAMIDELPQLEGGCVNYWEAGNWALNDDAEPRGPKIARNHRSVHMHLLGRSPRARHDAWRWGEAPLFPSFAGREAWAASFRPLDEDECRRVAERTARILETKYAMSDARTEMT
jgi:hypothetical protein